MKKLHELGLISAVSATAVCSALVLSASTGVEGDTMTAPTAAPIAVQRQVASQLRSQIAASLGEAAGGCVTTEVGSVIAAPGTPREKIDATIERMNKWLADNPWTGEGEGSVPPSNARFQPVDRWGGTAGRGVAVNLTYSFPPDGISVSGGTNSLNATLTGIYGSAATWQAIFATEFARWAATTGITYTQVSDDGATWSSAPGPFNGGSNRGDVRIVMAPNDGPSNVLAFNFFPDNGDMSLDVAENWGASTFFRNVLTHEHGHGLGLAHTCPDDDDSIGGFPILMKPFIDTGFLGPQFDDRLSAQFLYGDRFEPNSTGASAVNLPVLFSLGTNGIPVLIQDVSLHSSSEVDIYRVNSLGGTSITTAVTPVGPTYFEGPQNGGGGSGCVGNNGDTFNASSVADLILEVLNPNLTVAATANINGVGSGEIISGFVMPEVGNYFVRVRSASGFGEAQMYEISVSTSGGGNPADLSGDGCVNGVDLAVLLAGWGTPNADINGDNMTNSADLSILLASWQSPCP